MVHDGLVDPAVLALARPDAELVSVAKSRARHTLPQHEINALLVREALAGRDVVRLKGGDPFVFGRGGEEAEACRAAGVPVEVVPGISLGARRRRRGADPADPPRRRQHRQLRRRPVQGPDRAGLGRPRRQGPHAGDLHGRQDRRRRSPRS